MPADSIHAESHTVITTSSEISADSIPLIKSAVDGPSVSNLGAFLNPLTAVEVLLSSSDPFASELISHVGKHGSPKEVILAVQENLERLNTVWDSQTDEEISQTRTPTPCSQLITLISLYSSAIPRLKLGKKTPSEILGPLFSELENTIQLAFENAVGRQLITNVSRLITSVFPWVVTNAHEDEAELCSSKNLLYSLLECALTSWCDSICSALACRIFVQEFPRFASVSIPEPGWEEGEKAMSNAVDAATTLGGLTANRGLDKPTLASLILLAHSTLPFPKPDTVLNSMLPVIIGSIQSNKGVDESLSVLIMSLSRANAVSPKSELSPEIIMPLAAILPSFSSAHHDALIRHVSFRILSLLLSVTPSPVRLQILTDVLCYSDFPHMRIAAVGLVKEAVLEACAAPANDTSRNVFASPLFLQTLGPILFRPNPPDFFSRMLSTEELQDSPELPRLVECMALYYIVLLRDKNNRTGIHDTATTSNIKKSLLEPISSFLDSYPQDEHGHNMALAPLAVGLQRVNDALSTILVTPRIDKA